MPNSTYIRMNATPENFLPGDRIRMGAGDFQDVLSVPELHDGSIAVVVQGLETLTIQLFPPGKNYVINRPFRPATPVTLEQARRLEREWTEAVTRKIWWD